MQPPDRKGPEDGKTDEDLIVSGQDGVDVSLIRWMLSLSPAERLDVLQQNVNSILELRHAKTGN